MIAEWSTELGHHSTVLTFMIIHLFWFRLADDEQDWGTSWLIQLKLAVEFSSGCEGKRIVRTN